MLEGGETVKMITDFELKNDMNLLVNLFRNLKPDRAEWRYRIHVVDPN